MLLIDYSSAFNTTIPSKLVIKLEALGLNPALCNWVLDFLTGRTLVVKVGNNTSTSLILNTGAPQGWGPNSIIKFADDTTVVGLITNNDETVYEEVMALAEWGQENDISLNVNKTKGLIVGTIIPKLGQSD